MQKPSRWLASVSWQAVLDVNAALCHTQKTSHQPNPKTHEATRRLWEQSLAQNLPLVAALQICRKAQELAPFIFNNGNTFAAIGQAMVEDIARCFPPVEAAILRNTVGHYIAGVISEAELVEVLNYFDRRLKITPVPQGVSASGEAESEPTAELVEAQFRVAAKPAN